MAFAGEQGVDSLVVISNNAESDLIQRGLLSPVLLILNQDDFLIGDEFLNHVGAGTDNILAERIALSLDFFLRNDSVTGVGQEGREGSIGASSGNT